MANIRKGRFTELAESLKSGLSRIKDTHLPTIRAYGELGQAKGLRAVNRGALKVVDALDNPQRRMIGGWHASKARAGILSVDAHDMAPALISGSRDAENDIKHISNQLDYARNRGLPSKRKIVVMDDMPDHIKEALIDHATKNAYGERIHPYIDSDVKRMARSNGGGIKAFGYNHDIPQALIEQGRTLHPDSLWSHIESKDLIDAHNKYKKIRNIGLLGATVGGLGGVALLMANRKKNETPSSSGRVNKSMAKRAKKEPTCDCGKPVSQCKCAGHNHKSMAKRAIIQNTHESGRIHKMNTSRNKYFS